MYGRGCTLEGKSNTLRLYPVLEEPTASPAGPCIQGRHRSEGLSWWVVGGGPVKGGTRLLEKAVVWILLEDSPKEVIPLGPYE